MGMKGVFVNFSNHPSDKWQRSQSEATKEYGSEIVDVGFPIVPPDSSEKAIEGLANLYYEKITGYEPSAVMCQGEFTLCFSVVEKLKQNGITVLSACSERNVIEKDDKKISEFRFVRFRGY